MPYLALPVLEEYMLPFPFEESVWSRLETLPFPLVFGCRKINSVGCLLVGPFSLVGGVTFFFPRRMVVDKVKYVYYCCVTSADFVCSVRGVV